MPPRKSTIPAPRKSRFSTTGLTSQADYDIIRDTGVFEYPNCDIYVGWFLLDKEAKTIVRQGLGTYFVYVGGYYSGRWINDHLCRGKIKYPNGAIFWGHFDEMHKPQGEGTYYFPNRGWLTATFARGIPLANIKFLDKNYGEWLGTPSLISEQIVFQQKNIFMNRPSYAKAKRFDEMCKTEDIFSEVSHKINPICMPLNVGIWLGPSLPDQLKTIVEKRMSSSQRKSILKKKT